MVAAIDLHFAEKVWISGYEISSISGVYRMEQTHERVKYVRSKQGNGDAEHSLDRR